MADTEPVPPVNVRIEQAGGGVIPCEVRRGDPPFDGDGLAVWVAIPVGQAAVLRPGDQVRADRMPDGCVLRVPADRRPA